VPSANARLVRRGYEAWNRGDVEGVLSFLDPEIEWHGYTHIPESGTLEGRDDVKAWLERFLDAWEQLEIEVSELIDAGVQVVALVRFRGSGKGSGVPVEGGTDGHVWTVRDGRIVAVTLYQGTREALQSVGLENSPRS
jgi:ketosteroid isomerase-like protein